MIDFYYWPTPNGWKISIALEELGLSYRVMPVNIGRGDQFDPEFLEISPNGRMPAMVDHDPAGGGPAVSLFESGAILMYLAEKTGRLLAADLRGRHATMQWVMWQMGNLGPMLGQHGHFLLYAPEKVPYAIDRYRRETQRLYAVLDGQIGRSGNFVVGDYSIADIAIFPWIMTHKAQGIHLDDYANVRKWYTTLRGRAAVQRGLALGKEWRVPMDEEARRNLFGGAVDSSAAASRKQEDQS